MPNDLLSQLAGGAAAPGRVFTLHDRILKRLGGELGPEQQAAIQAQSDAAQAPAEAPETLPTELSPEQTIDARLKDAAGQDYSLGARKAVADREAERQGGLMLKLGAGLGGIGDVIAGDKPNLTGRLEDAKARIAAEETGKFDTGRKQALEQVGLENAELARQRKLTSEDAEFNPEHDPASDISRLARDQVAKLGLPVTERNTYEQIAKVYPFLKDSLLAEARKFQAQAGYGPADINLLRAGVDTAQGLRPLDQPLPTEGAGGKALTAVLGPVGAARGRENTEVRSRRLKGKQLTDVTTATGVLRNVDSIFSDVPGWNTGFLSNRVDLAKWYAGLDDPKKAAIRSRLTANLADYTRAMSGLAVTEEEAKRLANVAPTAEDSPDTLFAKLSEFRNLASRNLNNQLQSYRNVSDVEPWEEMATENGWTGQISTPASNPNAAPAPSLGAPPTAGPAAAASAPPRRTATTPDGRKVVVERGPDGRWHEVQ